MLNFNPLESISLNLVVVGSLGQTVRICIAIVSLVGSVSSVQATLS